MKHLFTRAMTNKWCENSHSMSCKDTHKMGISDLMSGQQ
jgi:hypothetical protein